ncbi:hypothetical protein GJ496_006565 [Pomphorhynchus laevis]|nr:hypothetical protein GJ496_006565 [Pomphorhynchus laevis]
MDKDNRQEYIIIGSHERFANSRLYPLRCKKYSSSKVVQKSSKSIGTQCDLYRHCKHSSVQTINAELGNKPNIMIATETEDSKYDDNDSLGTSADATEDFEHDSYTSQLKAQPINNNWTTQYAANYKPLLSKTKDGRYTKSSIKVLEMLKESQRLAYLFQIRNRGPSSLFRHY